MGGCEPIDLRTSSGERVDLTGIWLGGIFTHYVRQEGSCVWWVVVHEVPVAEEFEVIGMGIFRGQLAPDFSLTGEWMSVIRDPFISEPRRYEVSFVIDESADGESLVIRSTEPDAEQGGTGAYSGEATLTYEGPLPAGK